MDFGTKAELIAASMTIGEIQHYLDCDSLAYLSLENLVSAVKAPGAGFCTACLTGEYPLEVPVALSKQVLEVANTSA